MERPCRVPKDEQLVQLEGRARGMASRQRFVSVVYNPGDCLPNVLNGTGIRDVRYQPVVRYDGEDALTCKEGPDTGVDQPESGGEVPLPRDEGTTVDEE